MLKRSSLRDPAPKHRAHEKAGSLHSEWRVGDLRRLRGGDAFSAGLKARSLGLKVQGFYESGTLGEGRFHRANRKEMYRTYGASDYVLSVRPALTRWANVWRASRRWERREEKGARDAFTAGLKPAPLD